MEIKTSCFIAFGVLCDPLLRGERNGHSASKMSINSRALIIGINLNFLSSSKGLSDTTRMKFPAIHSSLTLPTCPRSAIDQKYSILEQLVSFLIFAFPYSADLSFNILFRDIVLHRSGASISDGFTEFTFQCFI